MLAPTARPQAQNQVEGNVATASTSSNLPPLATIDALSAESQSQSSSCLPSKKIHSDTQLQSWIHSESHSIYLLFITRLAKASIGKPTFLHAVEPEAKGKERVQLKSPTRKLLDLLDHLKNWTREVVPFNTPQRFGNLAFRDWGKRLDERIHQLHLSLLPSKFHPFIPELIPYFRDSFGSFVRLDYGSGHELAFVAWLCCLTRLGFGREENPQHTSHDDVEFESQLALVVFPNFLELVWGLQDRYALEPAGSHGVWGLDDYHFLPYVFGAAQLSEQDQYLPRDFASSSHNPRLSHSASSSTSSTSSSTSITPSSLLLFCPSTNSRIPPTGSNSKSFSSSPFPNLFTSSIARIHSIKRGPFNEHSPILSDISSSVPNWRKVSSGMIKMYDAECLSKRPVVQHFFFGGLFFKWKRGGDEDGPADEGNENEVAKNENESENGGGAIVLTQAPWASTGSNPTSNMVSHASNLDSQRIPKAASAPLENQFNSALGPRPSTSKPWLGLSSSSSSTGSSTSGKPGLHDSIGYAPMSIPGLGGNPSSDSKDQKKDARNETLAQTGSAAALSSPFGGLPKVGGGDRKT